MDMQRGGSTDSNQRINHKRDNERFRISRRVWLAMFIICDDAIAMECFNVPKNVNHGFSEISDRSRGEKRSLVAYNINKGKSSAVTLCKYHISGLLHHFT